VCVCVSAIPLHQTHGHNCELCVFCLVLHVFACRWVPTGVWAFSIKTHCEGCQKRGSRVGFSVWMQTLSLSLIMCGLGCKRSLKICIWMKCDRRGTCSTCGLDVGRGSNEVGLHLLCYIDFFIVFLMSLDCTFKWKQICKCIILFVSEELKNIEIKIWI